MRKTLSFSFISDRVNLWWHGDTNQNGRAHNLDTSVWRSGKKGRPRCGGGGLLRRKRSSNLLFCGSVCFSVGHSIFNLATVRVTTSTAPHTGAIEGANPHRRPSHQPPWRKTGGASSPLPGGKKPQSGFPIPESGRWIWWVRKKIGTRPSPFPQPDPSVNPTSAAATQPRQKRGQHREKCW